MAITKVSRGLLSTGIVDNSDATAITIDSSENVGIGQSTPEGKLHIEKGSSGASYTADGADSLILENSDSVAMDIRTPTNGQGLILFSDTTRARGIIGYEHSTDAFKINTAGSERMRIDSGGRVMIAETSNSGYSANADDLIVGDNGSSTERGISIGSTAGGGIRWNDGADAGIIQYAHSSNAMQFYTANSLAATIDSSGKVGIGTASPSAVLEVDSNVNAATPVNTEFKNSGLTGSGHLQICFPAATNNYATGAKKGDCVVRNTTSGGDIFFGANNAIRFGVAGTDSDERMRIDSTGKVQIGTTSALASSIFSVKGAATNSQQVVSLHNPATSGTVYFMAFGTETSYTERGFITYDQSNVAFTQASDITLKENIRDLNNGLDTICKIKPRVFDWKDGHAKDSVGFIAQEVEEVKPDWVKEKDGIKMLDTNLPNTIPYLIKAIQEQQEEIEQLKQNSHAPKTIEEMEGYEDLINRIKELENK